MTQSQEGNLPHMKDFLIWFPTKIKVRGQCFVDCLTDHSKVTKVGWKFFLTMYLQCWWHLAVERIYFMNPFWVLKIGAPQVRKIFWRWQNNLMRLQETFRKCNYKSAKIATYMGLQDTGWETITAIYSSLGWVVQKTVQIKVWLP